MSSRIVLAVRITRTSLSLFSTIPAALRLVSGITLSIWREVGGQVMITREHQPPPPEPDVRLVTASGSHGISYAFLIHRGCMPGQRDAFRRNRLDGSSDGILYRQGFVFGSSFGGWH